MSVLPGRPSPPYAAPPPSTPSRKAGDLCRLCWPGQWGAEELPPDSACNPQPTPPRLRPARGRPLPLGGRSPYAEELPPDLTPAASSTPTSGCSRSPTFDCITRLAGADSRGGDHRPSQLLPDSAVRSCRRGPQLSGIISQKQQLQLPALPLAFCSRSSITCSLCSSPPAPRTQQLAARSVLQQGGKDLIPVSPVAPARHGLRSSSCFSFSLDSLRKRATYGVLDPVFSCIGFTCKYLDCRSNMSNSMGQDTTITTWYKAFLQGIELQQEPEGRQYRYGDIQDQDHQLQGRGHRHRVIWMAENSTRDNMDRVEAHTASEAASVQTCHPRPLVWRTLVTIRSVAPTPSLPVCFGLSLCQVLALVLHFLQSCS